MDASVTTGLTTQPAELADKRVQTSADVGQQRENLVALRLMLRPGSEESKTGGEQAKCITWFSFALPCPQMDRSHVRSCHCPFPAGHRHECVRPLPGWGRAAHARGQPGRMRKCKAAGDVLGKD